MVSTLVVRFFYVFSIIQIVYQTTYPCDSSAPCGCSQFPVTTNARIVKGENAGFDTLSWLVSIPLGDDLCGGTIIHESFVVSAAHCFDHNFIPLNITVYAGSLNVHDGIRKTVSRVYSHPDYDKLLLLNDIALLKLASPLNLSDVNLAKICLPNANSTLGEYPPVNTSLVAAGWGTLWLGGPASPTLQQVTVQAVGAQTTYCQNNIRDPTIQFCAGIMPQGEKDTCQGDSGGPLMMFNSNQQWELVGVISYGRGCALPNEPSIYTRVLSYTKWINDTIQNSLSATTSPVLIITSTTTRDGFNNSANSINIPIYFLFSVLFFLFNQ